MARRAELSIDLPVPPVDAFHATCQALTALGFSVTAADPHAGIITASSSVGLNSWGEDLDLFVQPVTATSSTVVARSALKFGLADWGKNKRNLAKLQDAIHLQLGIAPGAAGTPGPGSPAGSPGALPPPPQPPSPAALQAPGWHPDPSGRFHHRWWDGQRWTDQVSTDGSTSTDPVPPPG